MSKIDFGPTGWTPDQVGSLAGKTYLATGANSGTGFEATRIFLAKGARVVMLNRNPEKSEAAIAKLQQEFGDDANVSFVRLDLSVLESVREAAAEVLKTVPKIDALIENAAIAQVPKQRLTVDGFESQLGTNHYGHFLLAGLLFDRIEESMGRIVVVASLGYKMGLKTIQFDDMNWNQNYGANDAYSQSKLAQMMFAYELQDRLAAAKKDCVEVYVCHPGSSKTSLIQTSGSPMMRAAFKLMSLSPMVQSAEKGAFPEVMCATQDGLEQRALYGPTGRMEFVGTVGKGTLESHAYEKPVMERLWDLSEKATDFEWRIYFDDVKSGFDSELMAAPWRIRTCASRSDDVRARLQRTADARVRDAPHMHESRRNAGARVIDAPHMQESRRTADAWVIDAPHMHESRRNAGARVIDAPQVRESSTHRKCARAQNVKPMSSICVLSLRNCRRAVAFL